MFNCVFVTVTVVDEDLCWFGHENKRIRYILGSTRTFYYRHCRPNLHANFCNLGKLTFIFILMKTKKARNNSINGHSKTLKCQCI